MDKFRGTLEIRLCNQESRSEGNLAFLVAEDGSELELCREGGVPIDDPYYEPFADMAVEIVGRVSHGALIVGSIEPIEQEEAPESEE